MYVHGDVQSVTVEVLNSTHKHLRNAFSSGSPELDRYLRATARQDMAKRATVVWVLLDTLENALAGHYTLNSHSVLLKSLSEEVTRTPPRYPNVPVILLGRLGVDGRYQGRGLGGLLLVNALTRAYEASRDIGAAGVVVHARDDAARRFYEHYGFIRFVDNALRFVMSMRVVEGI